MPELFMAFAMETLDENSPDGLMTLLYDMASYSDVDIRDCLSEFCFFLNLFLFICFCFLCAVQKDLVLIRHLIYFDRQLSLHPQLAYFVFMSALFGNFFRIPKLMIELQNITKEYK